LAVVLAFAAGEVAGVMDLAVDGLGVVDGFAVVALLAALFIVDGLGHVLTILRTGVFRGTGNAPWRSGCHGRRTFAALGPVRCGEPG
jgi:hypothetical protein